MVTELDVWKECLTEDAPTSVKKLLKSEGHLPQLEIPKKYEEALRKQLKEKYK